MQTLGIVSQPGLGGEQAGQQLQGVVEQDVAVSLHTDSKARHPCTGLHGRELAKSAESGAHAELGV